MINKLITKKEPKLQFPIETIIRNFIFTTSQDIWVGYKLAPQGFPLNDLEFFEKYIEDGKGIFEHDQYEYHLVNIPNYFDIEEHIEQTIKETVKGEFSDLGEVYFRQAGKILKDEVQMNEYETYLFVRSTTVVQVADPLEYMDLLKDIGKRLMHKMTAQHVPITNVPITYDRMEKQLFHDLSNYKEIERLTPQMMGRIFYYLFHRADTRIPERDLSPIEMNEGVISNENGYLVVEQIDKKHYSIFVSLIELPMAMFGSGFVQNLQDSLSFPIETHARLSFNHEKADLRKIGKMANRIYEQDKEQGQIDGILDEDDVLAFGTERLQDLKRKLKDKDTRLCQLSLTFVLSADSKEVLEQRMKDLQFALDGTDYKIYRSVADQLTLFNQCLIGSNRTFRSYDQIVTTGLVADLGFDLKKEVGNIQGIPLGRIITSKKYHSVKEALALSSKIIWYYPNLTKKYIEGAIHTNGNTLIIGPPGQGKSVLVKYIFLWLTFLGQKILYIDPKNETDLFFSKALEKYGHIPEFLELYRRINFISLSEDESCRGMLDPLLFLPREQAIQTAKSILELLGEVDKNPVTSGQKKRTIQNAIVAVLDNFQNNHLTNVIEEIRKTDVELADLLAGHQVGLGKILLGNDQSHPIDFSSQINVLGTQGLQIPTQKEIDAGRLKPEQIAGMAIMEVIMKFTYVFSTNKEEDAAIIFDEAKGFEDTAQGQFLIEDSLRKGRANGTDIYAVTQAFMDYDREDKKELISYKFAFRPKQKEARKKVLGFFDMEINEANQEMINQLKAGTCLFQDHKGRNQPIAIDVLFDSWLLAISSTDNQDKETQAALAMEQG